MELTNLLKGLTNYDVNGKTKIQIEDIAYDSRKVRKGSLFVCIDGFVTDGHKYISQAIKAKASAVMIQKGDFPDGVTGIKVLDTRVGLAEVSASFFDYPAKKMSIVGITGTKGKTTIAFMTDAIFTSAKIENGLFGTIINKIGDEVVYASRTTPESYDLQAMLADCVDKRILSCVMEVSSQGLALKRVHGCTFETGVFTNIYNDHIGPAEHKNLEEYVNAKAMLFDVTDNAVINIDANYSDTMIKRASSRCKSIYTVSLKKEADVRATNISNVSSLNKIGTSFYLHSPWYEGDVFVGMPGIFNVYNALCAIACAGIRGVAFGDVKNGLKTVSAKGRVQPVPTRREFQVIVDYAHNAASLESLLITLRDYAKGKLICVFGCGGDRAKSRRFEMGEVSGRLADYSVITSDNPRTENPESILADIESAIALTNGKYVKIVDRTEGIRHAILSAKSGDIVIIAGKGHETYQIFADKTIHYDDYEVAESIIQEMNK